MRRKQGFRRSKVSPLGWHILLTGDRSTGGGSGGSETLTADSGNGWEHCTTNSLVYVAVSGLQASGGAISTFPDTAALLGVGDWILSGGKYGLTYTGVHVPRTVAADSEFFPVIEPVLTNRPGRFEAGSVNFFADSDPTGINFDIALPEGTPGAADFRILVNTNGSTVVGAYGFNLMQVTEVLAQAYVVDEYAFGLNVVVC